MNKSINFNSCLIQHIPVSPNKHLKTPEIKTPCQLLKVVLEAKFGISTGLIKEKLGKKLAFVSEIKLEEKGCKLFIVKGNDEISCVIKTTLHGLKPELLPSEQAKQFIAKYGLFGGGSDESCCQPAKRALLKKMYIGYMSANKLMEIANHPQVDDEILMKIANHPQADAKVLMVIACHSKTNQSIRQIVDKRLKSLAKTGVNSYSKEVKVERKFIKIIKPKSLPNTYDSNLINASHLKEEEPKPPVIEKQFKFSPQRTISPQVNEVRPVTPLLKSALKKKYESGRVTVRKNVSFNENLTKIIYQYPNS